MAILTIELRKLLQTNFELFDFDYQFDDEVFKEELEQAVIDYYYFYEIGTETPERFKHEFRTTWKRIIPYYNKLYNTTLLEYNPLINSKMTEALEQLATSTSEQLGTTNTIATGSNTNTTSTTNKSDTVTDNTNTTVGSDSSTSTSDNDRSDYPQHVAGAAYQSESTAGTTESEGSNESTTTGNTTATTDTTATGLSEGESADESSSTNTQNITGQTNSNYQKTIEGMTGTTYQELIQKERANLLRIQQMVINELKTCFALLY